MNDLVRIVEVGYEFAADDESAWVGRVAGALRTQLGFDGGLIAFSFHRREDGWIEPRSIVPVDASPDLASDLLSPPNAEMTAIAGPAFARSFARSGATLATSIVGPEALANASLAAYFDRVLKSRGFADAMLINAVDPTQTGCMFFAPVRKGPKLVGRLRHRYDRLAAHVAAGFRLHRALGPLSAAAHEEEAVLETNGKLAHASGPATAAPARAALKEAVLTSERARGSLRKENPEEAVQIWRGLVAGRWSLIDRFDSDGRRYLVAHRNDPSTPDPRALTLREKQVLGFAALGQSNKAIAYALGISPSAVSALLRSANVKLGTERQD